MNDSQTYKNSYEVSIVCKSQFVSKNVLQYFALTAYYYVNNNAENQWIFFSILYNLHCTGKMEWGIYIKHIFLSQ